MKRQAGWTIGSVFLLSVTVFGCTNSKDDASNAALRTALEKQDQQEVRINELEQRLSKTSPSKGADSSDRIEALEKELAAVKGELEELKKRPPVVAAPPDKEGALKFMRGVAESFLEATRIRNNQSMAASMTRSLKANIAGIHQEKTLEYEKALEVWCLGRSGSTDMNDRKSVYTEWKITSDMIAPEADAASFNGTMTGPKNKGSFTLRVVKEKESGKYLVDLFNVTHE